MINLYDFQRQFSLKTKEDRMDIYENSESFAKYHFRNKYNVHLVKNNFENEFEIDLVHIDSNTFLDVKNYETKIVNGFECVYLHLSKLSEYKKACNEYPKRYNFTCLVLYHLKENNTETFKFISIKEIENFIYSNPSFIDVDKNYIPINMLHDDYMLSNYLNGKNVNHNIAITQLFETACIDNNISYMPINNGGYTKYIVNKNIIMYFEVLTNTFSRYKEHKKLDTRNCLITKVDKYNEMLQMAKNNKNKEVWLCHYIYDQNQPQKNIQKQLIRELVFCPLSIIESNKHSLGSTIYQKNNYYINFSKLDFISENKFFEHIKSK